MNVTMKQFHKKEEKCFGFCVKTRLKKKCKLTKLVYFK